MNKNPIIGSFPPYLKFLTFGVLVLFCLVIVMILGILIAVPIYGQDVLTNLSSLADATDPAIIAMSKYLQIVSQFAIFIIPSLIFAFLAGRNSLGYLALNKKTSGKNFWFAALVIIAAIPLINFLGDINQNIKLPEAWSEVEKWMMNSEEQAAKLTEVFLNVTTIGGLLVNILMIGILPAIGEEFLFRGVLQRLFHEWSKNIHLAVFFSAFLFSFIHFQFYGFIPRFALGMVLGYSFYWTGTLWTPILIHFINNSLAVLVYYFTKMEGAGKEYETIGTSEGLYWPLVISVGLTVFLLWKIYSSHRREKIIELSQNT